MHYRKNGQLEEEGDIASGEETKVQQKKLDWLYSQCMYYKKNYTNVPEMKTHSNPAAMAYCVCERTDRVLITCKTKKITICQN